MRDILGTGQHDMRNWSQRRLIATLAIAAIVVLEPVSWITASVPPCILDPADYAADFTEHYQCPTLYGFLLRHARTLYAFLTEPQVATVAVPLILAVSTLFLWWYSTRKLARAAIAAARAAQTSADALMAAEQAQLLTVFDTGNITQILSELGRADHGEGSRSTSGGMLFVKFVCKNYGKSTAILKEISHDLRYWKELPPLLRYAPSPDMPKERAIVAGASGEPIQCTLAVPVTSEIASSIRSRESFLWVYGRVLYDDAFGREREHRFLSRYQVGYGFQPYQQAEYETYNKNT